MSLPHLVALTHFYKIGPVSYQRLVAQFGAIEHAWTASFEDLALCIPANIAREFVAWRGTVDPQAPYDDAIQRGLTLVAFDDPAYPSLLKTIHDPPYLLYVRGTLPPADAVCVGVVGSRRATDYGLRVAKTLSHDLAKHVVIVSGLADGIDGAAHRGALEAHGSTVAVLGGGIDAQDRSQKIRGMDDIIAHGGAVISEFAPTLPPQKFLFPVRNRIIAGISKGVLVVEAAIKSGSLITARAAIAENREVFAVPGSIFSETSEGTHMLIRDGAHMATSAGDVLSVLGFNVPVRGVQQATTRVAPTPPNLDATAMTIWSALTASAQHIDDVARATELPAAVVLSTLTMMEIEGHVQHLGGMRYVR